MTDSSDGQNPVPGLPLHDLAGFTHRWVEGDGVRLHVVEGDRSAGPAVVLLAGFPQTWWAWRTVMPALAERFHVIAVDLPGQGHSERPHGSYDTHTVAAHVQAALSALDVPTYWLVAHDIGAWVAFSLALKYEEHLHGVALLDAGIPGITLPESVPLDPERAWKTWHFAFHLVPELPETLLTGRERDYVDWFLRAKTLSPDTFDGTEVDQYAAAIAAEGGLRASLAYYRDAPRSARANRDALERGRLTVPVLGISSSHGSIPDMAASLGPWAENTTGVVIPEAGHFIPDEQPGAVVQALTAFLDQKRAG
ncbi:alpha/beta fold hydrolase [Streptomyces sp. CMSTAAHL-2]|uniref:alpha/beta fold hydrolase n=1 Tax=Streptomyces sp. CMSTAAHL-2 TaxID=2904522 RepID=UPI001E435FDF|nr:alpha/beta hydrolase [Streptomyces sp. CMSTAAHL-2]MCE3029436.1 alpha/beta hydrolase [Streptomyces sp. CMSTAAHL-2]